MVTTENRNKVCNCQTISKEKTQFKRKQENSKKKKKAEYTENAK